MVNEGRGRLFRRKDGKCLIYLPKDLCEDSMFPFKNDLAQTGDVHVKVSFKIGGKTELLIEEWKEKDDLSLK